jgi:SH3 domain protein
MHRSVAASRRLRAPLMLAVSLAVLATPSGAERAWVKEELRLNLRAGPGVQYRILGVLKSGDLIEVVSRSDEWIQVRVDGKENAWIPAGYLQSEPPPSLRLTKIAAEATELRDRVASLSEEAVALRSANEDLQARDATRSAEMEDLVHENQKLRAGERWPEWIAGACILGVGMIAGAVLHRNATRRKTPRIRL